MSKQLSPERRAARSAARQAATRRHEDPAARGSRWFNPWVPALVALCVALVSGLVAWDHRGSGRGAPSTTRAEAQTWRDAVLVDLRPLTGTVVTLGRTMTDWQAGRVSAALAAGALDVVTPRMQEARAALARRSPFAGAPRALDDFRLTASLYLEAARVARLATDLPAGPLRTQLQNQFMRVRDLADRFFDQAGVELQPLLGKPRPVEGVEIRPTSEVPDWRSIDLAVGPPLDVVPPRTALRAYQSSRPQESMGAWKADVGAAGIPSVGAEAAALRTAAGARDLARQLVAASDRLHDTADPMGMRVVSTRVQLALLVDAEAMRAAQATTLVPPSRRQSLLRVANGLAYLGDIAWDASLGARSTGVPASSLD